MADPDIEPEEPIALPVSGLRPSSLEKASFERPTSNNSRTFSRLEKWTEMLRWNLIRSPFNSSFFLENSSQAVERSLTPRQYWKGASEECEEHRAKLGRELGLTPDQNLDRHAEIGQLESSMATAEHPQLRHYKHTPLSEDSYRCFVLEPGEGSEPLEGRFKRILFKDGDCYETVSHRWATTPRVKAIGCGNDTFFSVDEDIAAMLLALRLPNARRYLWIDSLCIDQDNLSEKSVQIGLMGTIYKKSTGTIIWLGIENRTTPAAFEMLDQFWAAINNLEAVHGSQWIRSHGNLRLFGLPESTDMRWKPVQRLICHPWFTRKWIFQEIFLSKHAWIQCGRYSLEWNHFQQIILAIERENVSEPWKSLKYPRTLQTLETIYLSSQPKLLYLLDQSRFARAKLGGDSVFAMLGLASDEIAIRGLVDYVEPTESTFTKIATHYLSAGYLDVLNMASEPDLRTLRGLPSWVPDWTTPGITIKSQYAFDENRPQSFCPDPPEWPRTQAQILDSRILSLRGFEFDQVKATGLPTIYQDNTQTIQPLMYKPFIDCLQQWRQMVLRLQRQHYITGEALQDAFAQTVAMGLMDDYPAQTAPAELLDNLSRHLFSGDSGRGSERPHSGEADFDRYTVCVNSSCAVRKFFITRNGYFGLGPMSCQPGDRIVWFDSGFTPFVIRKARSGCYTLVGETYIRGRMDFKPSQSDYKEFRLV